MDPKLKRSIAIGMAAFALTGAALAANEQTVPENKPEAVNPARCNKGNKAYVYWAAKDQVFRFKYDPAQPIHPYPESLLTIGKHFDALQEIPPAPIPSEPLGCYGNPLRALQVPYINAFEAELFQKLAGRKFDRGVTAVGGFYALPTNYYESSVEERVFRKATNCWLRPSGIHECLLPNITGKKQPEYLVAHPLKIEKDLLPRHPQVSDVYVTVQLYGSFAPNGQKWLSAKSRILLFGNVSLESDFLLFPQEIDLLIPYYTGLIHYVLDAHIPDYKWSVTKAK